MLPGRVGERVRGGTKGREGGWEEEREDGRKRGRRGGKEGGGEEERGDERKRGKEGEEERKDSKGFNNYQ